MKLWKWLKSWLKSSSVQEEEWMLWVRGPGPPPDDVVGSPVDFNGRRGVVIDKTLLTILVRWD